MHTNNAIGDIYLMLVMGQDCAIFAVYYNTEYLRQLYKVSIVTASSFSIKSVSYSH